MLFSRSSSSISRQRIVASIGSRSIRSVWLTGAQLDIVDSSDSEAHMTGSLHVRNLEEEIIARLKRRAARHGRSAEAEHREILRQALAGEDDTSFEALAAELRELTKGRRQTPSEILLREGRDER